MSIDLQPDGETGPSSAMSAYPRGRADGARVRSAIASALEQAQVDITAGVPLDTELVDLAWVSSLEAPYPLRRYALGGEQPGSAVMVRWTGRCYSLATGSRPSRPPQGVTVAASTVDDFLAAMGAAAVLLAAGLDGDVSTEERPDPRLNVGPLTWASIHRPDLPADFWDD